LKDGRTLSWNEAMAEFRDATGRPGPAAWELGTYPEGHDDHPVRGVSWYEAVAYARFAGQSLPTVHHWRRAAVFGGNSAILELSNFAGKAPARVGEFQGLGRFGTYDMAGNVKEWCWNAVGDRRYILGGAWNEPNYQYRDADARVPFDRSSTNGFRLMATRDPAEPSDALLKPVERLARDYDAETPVANDVYRAYASLYSYDASELKPAVESVDVTSPWWRIERITFSAPYGSERIIAHLFLPKSASPPYQTVVYFPHNSALVLPSFDKADMSYLGFFVKAGRALMVPIYKGMFERRLSPPAAGPNALRDVTIQQMKDLRRSIDYLETRPDIDSRRVAYYGISLGARLGSIALAVEHRFKAAVLYSGGLPLTRQLPEIDELNYAPRVTTPVLLLSGRDDFMFPVRVSQLPLLQRLGTPNPDKRRIEYDGGHQIPFTRTVKDTLDWLDKYLGVPK
jgi:predicted esterase